MSDCGTQAMMPKKRRTCGTCKHVKYTYLDCFHAANDSSYYMRCTRPDMRACEHYMDDPDSLPRRYERLAQVAGEMLETIRGYVSENLIGSDPRLKDAICEPYVNYRGKLEECGVSVDD